MKAVNYYFAIILLSAIIDICGQNTTLLSNLDQYSAAGYNDCWGYVDSLGREYALLGTRLGTSIIEITNPLKPVERAFIPGPNSAWRDIKTHSNYAYIVTEGTGTGRGLQIVDLTGLPSSAALVKTIDTWFARAHNLYIDNGYAYVVGTDNGGGMHILDLSDPVHPIRTAYYTESGYIHDVYVWNDTAYASSEDTYDLIDLTDKSDPKIVSQSAALPGIYAHSGWLTEDKRYFIACEEFDVRDITVWDLQDRSTWNLVVPSFGTKTLTPVHNPFVKGNFVYISYYNDGLVVIDITDPANPVKAGQYDTYPGTSGSYTGAWGCYPYFPSGVIIISDMQTGLYVVDFLFDPVTPVELISFTAAAAEEGIILMWETATERNNYGFQIERRFENENVWRVIAVVPGTGTSAESTKYNYTDNSLTAAGRYYYRLKQTDNDGAISYSDELSIEYIQPEEFVLQQNYPNPFNPETTLEFIIGYDSFVKLEIYNSLGEKVSDLIKGNMKRGLYKMNFEPGNLPSGIYIAKLETKDEIRTIKMTLLR